MWRRKTSVADQPRAGADPALNKPDSLDLRILGILEEAGTGQSLRHARRATDDLALMMIGSGTSTCNEFDQSLERLEAQGMIRLDKDGFANLGERGRDRIHPRPGFPVQETDARAAATPPVHMARGLQHS